MNNHEALYNETFTLSTPYLDESNYHTAELIHELISKNIPHTHTQDFYSFELPSNVFAFLINKLSSNLSFVWKIAKLHLFINLKQGAQGIWEYYLYNFKYWIQRIQHLCCYAPVWSC